MVEVVLVSGPMVPWGEKADDLDTAGKIRQFCQYQLSIPGQ